MTDANTSLPTDSGRVDREDVWNPDGHRNDVRPGVRTLPLELITACGAVRDGLVAAGWPAALVVAHQPARCDGRAWVTATTGDAGPPGSTDLVPIVRAALVGRWARVRVVDLHVPADRTMVRSAFHARVTETIGAMLELIGPLPVAAHRGEITAFVRGQADLLPIAELAVVDRLLPGWPGTLHELIETAALLAGTVDAV